MLLGRRATNHSNLPYHHSAERLPLRHIGAEGLLLGRVAGSLRGKQATFLSGCQNTLMPKWVGARATSTNIALLCLNTSADRLKVMSLFTTKTVLRMITELKTLSCLLRMFIGDKLYVLTVRRSLQ